MGHHDDQIISVDAAAIPARRRFTILHELAHALARLDDELATAALKKLEEKRITSLMVCNGDGVVGVLHVHDLWGVGLF